MSDDHCRSSESTPNGDTDGSVAQVRVLGAFGLRVGGQPVPLPVDSRRLVAYLAVHPRPQPVPLRLDSAPNRAPLPHQRPHPA